ncbi:MAG: hypothetical protein DYH13_00450 [Alphaproteobacteria bacterium PRO2]|nr:hypothetical protein [Alphaproteobacteria bacterium PRO2]
MTFQSVKKISLAFILLITLLAALYCGIAAIQAPNVAAQKARLSLRILGLNAAFLPEPRSKWGHVIYNDIKLDEDEISTIETIDISYNPLSILLTGRLNTLTFKNLNLIGEWDPGASLPATFSGWKIPNDFQHIAVIPAQNIRMEKSKISVLTVGFGGLSLDFDFNGAFNDKKLEFQSHLKSAQKYMSFTASASGILAHDFSNIDVEIDEGKFEMPEAHIRASRGHGWFNYTRDKSGSSKIMAELRAGGLTVLEMPWQNASATLEIKDGSIKAFSDAKSIGVDGIELGLNYQKNAGAAGMIYGSLHADDGAALSAFLGEQSKITLPAADMTIIRNTQDLKADFAYEPEKIKYRLNTMQNAPVKEVSIK